MKKIKVMLVMVLTTGLVFTAVAQPKHKKGKGKLDSIATKYNFSETQKTQFKQATLVQRKQTKAIKNSEALSKEDKKTQIKQARQGLDSSLKTFLSTEQYNSMKADNEKKREAQKAHNHEKRQNNVADSLKAKYNLSADQHTKVQVALTNFNAAKKAAKETGEKGSDENKTAIKKARKDFDVEMKSILTDAQYKQWKADVKAKKQAKKAKKH